MAVQRHRVKDGSRAFGEELVPFLTPVPEIYLCSQCSSLAEHMRRDSQGHVFCDPCLVELGVAGQFLCMRDGASEQIDKMTTCNHSFEAFLNFQVQCPKKDSGCGFSGKLRELRDHLPACRPRRAITCSQCFSLVAGKNLAEHKNESCPKRRILCRFCDVELEAWTMNYHVQQCESRPATCEYCKETIATYLKLKRDHLPACPAKPMPCCFKELGCTFTGTKDAIDEHMKSGIHMELMVKGIMELKASQQEDRMMLSEVTKLNNSLDECKKETVTFGEEVRGLKAELRETSRNFQESLLIIKEEERHSARRVENALENMKEHLTEALSANQQASNQENRRLFSEVTDLKKSLEQQTSRSLEEFLLTFKEEERHRIHVVEEALKNMNEQLVAALNDSRDSRNEAVMLGGAVRRLEKLLEEMPKDTRELTQGAKELIMHVMKHMERMDRQHFTALERLEEVARTLCQHHMHQVRRLEEMMAQSQSAMMEDIRALSEVIRERT